MADGEMQGSPFLQENFIVINIMFGVAAAIDGEEHTRNNQLNEIRPIHTSPPPLYLIVCCFTLTNTTAEIRRHERVEEDACPEEYVLGRVNACLNASIPELEIKESREGKTAWASIAK